MDRKQVVIYFDAQEQLTDPGYAEMHALPRFAEQLSRGLGSEVSVKASGMPALSTEQIILLFTANDMRFALNEIRAVNKAILPNIIAVNVGRETIPKLLTDFQLGAAIEIHPYFLWKINRDTSSAISLHGKTSICNQLEGDVMFDEGGYCLFIPFHSPGLIPLVQGYIEKMQQAALGRWES